MGRAVTYYEAFGETRNKLIEMLDKRNEALEPLREFCKEHGGVLLYSDGISFRAGLGVQNEKLPNGVTNLKEPKNPKLWKRVKGHPEAWEPRWSSKEGRKNGNEFNALASKVLSATDFATYLKVHIWGGGAAPGGGIYMNSVRVFRVKKRIIIANSEEDYKIPKDRELKRISDLDFEKIVPKTLPKKDLI